MDGDDRLRPRRDALGHICSIEVQTGRIDVAEDGCRASARDRLGRGEEGEGRADDLVPRPDPERVEHDHERVGAVRDADRVVDAEVRRGFALEGLDVGAEDEASRVDDLRESLVQLAENGRVLRSHVNERNHKRPV